MPTREERQRSGAIAAPAEFSGAAAAAPRAAEATAAAPPQRRAVGHVFGRGIRELAETIILALLIFLMVRAVVQNFQVEGTSMQPSLQSGWYLLVNKAIYFEINLDTVHKFLPFVDPGDDPTRYIFRGPKRGDIIVFRAPDQQQGQPERNFIKRVIAVSGESVEVREGIVFINGLPLDEPYIDRPGGKAFGPEIVPADHLFVLGDNRQASRDSRDFGMLPKENVIGKAWVTYWPFSVFGFVSDTSSEPGSGLPAEPAGELDPAKDAAAVPAGASP